MKAFKLLRLRKDRTLGPLFINARLRVPVGTWLESEAHRTKGYAFRPGWHCTTKPVAPHLSTKGRVWCEVEVEDHTTYARPESQGGSWILAKRMKVMKVMSNKEEKKQ